LQIISHGAEFIASVGVWGGNNSEESLRAPPSTD
jgi:hypothetical protein